jgi:hypothetical protein
MDLLVEAAGAGEVNASADKIQRRFGFTAPGTPLAQIYDALKAPPMPAMRPQLRACFTRRTVALPYSGFGACSRNFRLPPATSA